MNKKEKQLMKDFFKKAKDRHDKHEKKYGNKWRTTELKKEIEEELIDIVNYCAYFYVRLKKLESLPPYLC